MNGRQQPGVTDPPSPLLARDLVDGYLVEDEVVLEARTRAAALGALPIGPAAGATLCFLAATVGARAVVEVGTGTGVSGLWLLRGMAPDGVLTSIDVDPEKQRVARGAFLAAGYGPSRLRLINGLGLEVLPRLTDGGYDLVFVDALPVEYPRHLDEAVRLLRPGGLLVLDDMLPADGADAPWWSVGAPDDPAALAVREVIEQVRDDERLVPLLLPVGNGLLCALRT
jgi:predicted O-methyltransferase YrrM